MIPPRLPVRRNNPTKVMEYKNYSPAVMLGADLDINVDLGNIDDSNGNAILQFDAVTSAVNYARLANAATGADPVLSAQGSDTNVSVAVQGKGTGEVKLGQATSAGVRLAADQPLLDSSGNELVKFAKTSSAVNEVTVTNASTGNAPSVSATGETNVGITVAGKGTGSVNLGQATTTGVKLVADQPILDSAGLELVKFVKTATAINEITVTNAASGGNPDIAATGDGTNISLTLTPKGTGKILINDSGTVAASGGAATLNRQLGVVTTESLSTAAGATYTLTLTDSKISATSVLMASVGLGTSTAGTPVVAGVVPGAGSATIVVQNIHAANAFNGTLVIHFIAL